MDRAVQPKDTERAEPPRLWTPSEANARIADLTELLPRLKGWVVRLGEVHEELKRLAQFWGSDVDAPDHADHELKLRLDAEWKNLTRRLEEVVTALRGEGIELKDLENGLVDFYAVVDDELVFLCWQRGEPSVGYYHPVGGSSRDRRPIPQGMHSTAPPRPRGFG
jgi:hypothetical protein